MGPPGSGKGTQSKLLVSKLGFVYFSMGDTLREYAKMDTDLGREIKQTIDQGIIVPDDIAKRIFVDKFASFQDSTGVVLDGYPRTIGQTEVLDGLLTQYQIQDFRVLFLDVDKQKLLQRLALRKTCPNCQAIYLPGVPEYETEICKVCGHKIAIRKDDTELTYVEKRFDEYMTKTADVKKYYEDKGLLVHINGDQLEEAQESIAGVHQEILSKLGV